MKKLLFNIYKATYIHFNRNFRDVDPSFISAFSATVGVTLFLGIILTDLWVLFIIITRNQPQTLNKNILWPSIVLFHIAVYLLLFKVLRLRNLNYAAAENRPSPTTTNRAWLILAINFILWIVLIIIKGLVQKGII